MSRPEFALVRGRRKTVAIHVLADGAVEVRAPHWVARRDIDAFVAQRADWIAERRAALARRPPFEHPEFFWGGAVRVLGERQVLWPSESQNACVDALMLAQCPIADSRTIEAAWWRWCAREALQLFTERVEFWRVRLSPEHLPPITIKVRRMRSRWGSCRRSGLLTFNTHLLKYPMECVDAVVVHELCHFLHFNHGKAFYAAMDRVNPNWRVGDRMLNELSRCY